MIPYHKAQQIVKKYAKPLGKAEQLLAGSLGSVLASNLRSPMAMPSFDNSAMDGFALNSEETAHASAVAPVSFKICGAIRAGCAQKQILRSGQAFRIMTGAPIPQGANTVLEKEKADAEHGVLRVNHPLEKGRHVRRRGEEIARDEMISLKGAVVTSGLIGFLSGLGVKQISVYKKPRISVIATGDEIVRAGKKLKSGQIYDSNTPMLAAALKAMALSPRSIQRIADDKAALQASLFDRMRSSDLVILTGGVSVGDYDLAKEVFTNLGIRTLFWRVRQKPGKPIFFGIKNNVLIFGLPGNPAAVYACFYQFVYPAIRLQMGYANPWMHTQSMLLKHSIRPDREKTLLLKAITDPSPMTMCCEALGHQGSHMLSSLCRSHGFILVPPGQAVLKKGSRVCFQFVPGALP